MEKVVTTFLQRHWDQKSPLLLGYSGGPDSKALLYALWDAGVRPHVAHVDHGWRVESGQEAAGLKREVEGLGLPFHSIRIAPVESNREAKAREERFEFFLKLSRQFGCLALLLAHQADDLAETVLKRILEGAHLSASGGMQPVSRREGLAIWRPLISVKKAHLLSFLERRKLQPLFDPTQGDLRYRMRKEIFPVIQSAFGKEVVENLAWFSERAYELKEYLERKCSRVPVLRGPWGEALFLKEVERVEARFLLHKHLSRNQLETALDWIEEGGPNRKVNAQIFVDRGVVFILSKKEPQFAESELRRGVQRVGDWEVEVVEAKEVCVSDWKQVWAGEFSSTVAAGEYELRRGLGKRKLWNERKVPAFFRSKVPVLCQRGEVVGEFLSGKGTRTQGPWVKISFKLLNKNEVE